MDKQERGRRTSCIPNFEINEVYEEKWTSSPGRVFDRIRRASTSAMLENGTSDDNTLSWEEKYHQAESQLLKFRTQAGRVRELLNVKLKEFEARATDAEEKTQIFKEKVEKLEMVIKDKDEAISALREKITGLREKMVKDSALWEERDKKIKDWIKDKFTELLRQIETLKVEKKDLESQLSKASSLGKVSVQSNASDTEGHLYEEIFDQIMADLRRPSLPPSMRPTLEDLKLERPKSPWDEGVPPKPHPRKKSCTPSSTPTWSPSQSPVSQSPSTPRSKIPIRSPPPPSSPPPLPKARKASPFKKKHLGLPSAQGEFGSLSSLTDEVFDQEAEDLKKSRIPLIRRQSSSALSEFHVPLPSEGSSSEPLYFTLKETYYGVDFEEESKTPVYATLKGVAAQIRDSPFTGESTDSEADTENSANSRKNTVTSVKASTDDDQTPKRPLKTCAPFTAQNMRVENLDRAGYLTKLGGRVKNWKKRWFVLSEGKLSYYKTQNDMHRKPLGQIVLDDVIDIIRSEKLHTFEMLLAARTYYMTADNGEECDEWIRVLKGSLRRFAGARMLSKTGEKTVHKGWVTRVKGGSSRHCLCVLKEKSMVFYKTEIEQAPVNAINLREVVKVSPVDVQGSTADNSPTEEDVSCTLMIQCIKDTHPVYLVIPSKAEMDEWYAQISNLCSNVKKEDETSFESTVTKLMSVDGDEGSHLWRSGALIHSRSLLKEPLTTLPTEDLRQHALKLFKSIQLFSTTRINELAIDYHLALAQDTLHLCFLHRELQTEIYCQLIKQTTKYRHKQGLNRIQTFLAGPSDWVLDSVAGDQTIDMSPVAEYVYVQCWQLLALCTSLFLPKLKILWFLKIHLSQNENANTDAGRYALYCQRSLERTIKAGDREARPSRLEVLSIILRNPYYRPLPMSIAVHFVNGTHQVFCFDGSSTVAEFCDSINTEIGIRECNQSGYALFTDNPIAPAEHCLQFDLKLCDVISKWEQAMKNFRQGKVEKQKVIKLTYKCRLYFKSLWRGQTEKERLLLAFQVNDSILAGNLLPSTDNVCYLAGLLAQTEYGNYVDQFKYMDAVMKRFVPERLYEEGASYTRRKIYKIIADFWSTHRLKGERECVSLYLTHAKKIPFFGAKLFEAKEKILVAGKKEDFLHVWLSIEEDKITVLTFQDRDVRAEFSYTSIATFGGYKDDFMLVVQDGEDSDKTERRLFAMPHAKVLETTFLVASYINAVVTRHGLNLEMKRPVTGDGNAWRGKGKGSRSLRLWDMESSG